MLCLAGALSALGCDRAPVSESRAVEPALVTTAVTVMVRDSSLPGAVSVVPVRDREILGPSAQGSIVGFAPQVDPTLTLFEPAAAREVTLAPVVGATGRKGWAAPTLTLFGSPVQPWLVQLAPRMEVGRNAGLTLRGGTQGQHNRWDLGASATVGANPNMQGVVRFHP